MKRSQFLIALCLVLGTLTLNLIDAEAATQPTQANPIKLTYSNYFPAPHPHAILGKEFCEEIKKRTNGRVEITYIPGGTLTSASRVYDGVLKGVSDMGMSNIAYTRGRFPVTEILDLPLGFPSGWVATHVANDFFRQFKPNEWNEVRVIYLHACGPNVIYTSKKPVYRLEDLKGLKIRGTGRIADVVKALGASPIPIETPDLYDSLSRGVVDGAMNPMALLSEYKLGEVIKYTTECWQVGNVYNFYVVMNKNKWNILPEDLQKVFAEVADEWIEKHGRRWNETDFEGKKFSMDLNGKFISLPPDEVARWQQATRPVVDAYMKDMEAKGFSSKEMVDHFEYAKGRIKYWNSKQDELGIKSATSK